MIEIINDVFGGRRGVMSLTRDVLRAALWFYGLVFVFGRRGTRHRYIIAPPEYGVERERNDAI